jgi:uncharacterized integral membrane protein (TIGR00697 family)
MHCRFSESAGPDQDDYIPPLILLTRLDTRSKMFLTLAAVFISALLVGDIIGGKLFEVQVFGFTINQSVGIIPFPITFLLTDLLNEFYGKRAARVVTWVGFGMAVFTFTIITLAVALPFAPMTRAPDWGGITEPSFNQVFGGSQQILIASMVAYLLAQFTDIFVFNRLKMKTGGQLLWLRATGSTLVSQAIDTAVIQTGAWFDKLTPKQIVSLIATAYVTKIFVAVALTPLIYLGHTLMERLLGLKPVTLDAHGEVIESPAPTT